MAPLHPDFTEFETAKRAQRRAEYQHASSVLSRYADRVYILQRAVTGPGEEPAYFAGMDGEDAGRRPRFTADPEQAAWFYTAQAAWWQRSLEARFDVHTWAQERSRPQAVESAEFDGEAMEAEADQEVGDALELAAAEAWQEVE